MLKSSKIKPFLGFDTRAEEAARFYTSIFERVMKAMLPMIKLDIRKLKEAAR